VTFSIPSRFLHIQPSVLQAPAKNVILSEALRRSIANRGLMARSRRTPAMLLGRCSWELSGRKLHRKKKSGEICGLLMVLTQTLSALRYAVETSAPSH
jgi:hypothetical protein